MSRNNFRVAVCTPVLLLLLLSATGCVHTTLGPNLGLLGWPVPMSPYAQKMGEDNYYEHERYERVPIMGPITAGGPAIALDPPSEDEIMRALEDARGIEGGVPFLHEVQRNNVRIVVEPIADYVDPPRVYPLVGPAQLHHAQYKCIIYFSEATWVGWPIPYKTVDEDVQEVVYIDHSHLHMVGNVDGGPGAPF